MKNIFNGLIGGFGGVVFTVSDSYMKTFQTLEVSRKARFVDHEVAGNKPVSEYIGETLDEVRFMIRLTSNNKISPLIDLAALGLIKKRGIAQRLIIGIKNFGKFTLREFSDSWLHVSGNGYPMIIDVELVLVEYIETISNQAMTSLSTDQSMKEVTGKGGPVKLPGTLEVLKDRLLVPFE